MVRTRLWAGFGRLAERRALVVLVSGVLTFLACLTIDLIRGHDPVPEVHDECAYLLAGDTFAHGRMTNPAHELWRSFETFHVLQRPTYQAKYPPGQGLFLALGQVLAGRPIVGVWISASLFVSALCWMLQSWFPVRWALLGTILGACTVVFAGFPLAGGVVGYWTQSYWGGSVAAMGGALLLGGLRRVVTRPRWNSAAVLGLGAVVMALSRPFEGLLVALPGATLICIWLVRSRNLTVTGKAVRVVLPAAVVLALGLSWLGFYNQRVTGSPFKLPYMEYRQQYQTMPIWTWQPVREEPVGLNKPMLDYARWELNAGRAQSEPARRAADTYRLLCFEVGPILAPIMLLMLPWTVRSRWIAFAAGSWGLVLIGQWMSSYFEVHYHAPAAPLSIILATAALRRIAIIRKGPRRIGLVVSLALLVATLGNGGLQWREYLRTPERYMEHWAKSRQEVVEKLTESGGRHVVFVRYGPGHHPDVELVYNGSDIDGSPIIWARELDEEQNARVRAYYPDRKFWLFNMYDDHRPAVIGP